MGIHASPLLFGGKEEFPACSVKLCGKRNIHEKQLMKGEDTWWLLWCMYYNPVHLILFRNEG